MKEKESAIPLQTTIYPSEQYQPLNHERLLYCNKCKTDEMNNIPNAKCSKCGNRMLKVVFSALSGERITGNELVKTVSGSTLRDGKST